MIKTRKEIVMGIICLLLVLSGCGGNVGKEVDISLYKEGVILVDLGDADVYFSEGKKMAEIVGKVIAINVENEPDNIHEVEFNSELFGNGYFKKTVNSSKYVYYGKLKDERPNGFGALFEKEGSALYIGEFKKGNLDGYGIYVDSNTGSIVFEGNIDGITKEGNVVMADGEAVVPFTWNRLVGYYGGWSDGIFGLSESQIETLAMSSSLLVMRLAPQYIGELKDEEYNGEGTLYNEQGEVIYKGGFKNGKYSGKGILYYSNGNIKYEGEFSKGEYDGKGVLYYEDGSVEYKGSFKKGDID